jgi:tRNA U34 2-thiouridine synthase MnmA/TrmU
MIKAISLISGGLDSTLATKVIMDQGIEVIAANFISPFCRCDHKTGCRHEAAFVSDELKIPLKMVNISKDFLEVLKSPKHGYGSNMNPCIDCRILMLKKAKELMDELGASFLITGEVLGQRPMSQRRDAMRTIEKDAGVLGLVLRPLSAKLLEPTIPEEKGWVDRQKLLDFSGRSRKAQIQLACDYNIKDYPCPAGGCLLTDPAFSKRIKDLIGHNELTMDDVKLLNHGRHFRIADSAKLIVGRNEHDNDMLRSLRKESDLFLMPIEEEPGASALGRGAGFDDVQARLLAAKLVARYFDCKCAIAKVVVLYKGKEEVVEVAPFTEEESKQYLI